MWVLGSPRSGSTWLLSLLGQHDDVVPVNEPLIGSYLGPFMSDLPGWDASAVTLENFTMRRVQAENGDHFFADAFRDVWLRGLRDMMLARFTAHIERYPRRRSLSDAMVVIKEPNGSQSADVIMSALPQARLLFLLRDGRDVVDSELAANRPGAWGGRVFPGGGGISDDERLAFVVQSAQKWLWRTEVTQHAYAAHRGPKRLVRYEELREDPVRGFRDVLDWLGLEADDEWISAVTDRHAFERLPAADRGPDKFFRAATPGLWRENLSADEQQAVMRILGPKLSELGYEG